MPSDRDGRAPERLVVGRLGVGEDDAVVLEQGVARPSLAAAALRGVGEVVGELQRNRLS